VAIECALHIFVCNITVVKSGCYSITLKFLSSGIHVLERIHMRFNLVVWERILNELLNIWSWWNF